MALDFFVCLFVFPPSGANSDHPFVFSNPKCAAELDGWNLEFEKKLISYSARVLPTETIMQADGSKVSKGVPMARLANRWMRE